MTRVQPLVILFAALAMLVAVVPASGARPQQRGQAGVRGGYTTDPGVGRASAAISRSAATAARRSSLASVLPVVEPDEIVIEDGLTQPAFSYADAIRETVHIPGAVSSEDGDELDVINVDIIRPAASEGDLDVPTIIVPSPYYHATGRGRAGELKPPPRPPYVLFGDEEIEGRLMSRFLNVAGEEGLLVDCGLATAADPCPAEVAGEVALIERGVDSFVSKVNHAFAAGAIGVVMFNNADGFIGSTVNLTDIPVVDLMRSDGLALRDAAAQGDVDVSLEALFRDIDRFPLYYDNYFVPRGYAVAQLDLAGTRGSTGCLDIGGPAEIDNTAKLVEWLNGKGVAFDVEGNPVDADWSNGLSGMVGKSWDGTVANGVASRGVDGLATIVPIAAISSWAQYYWANGAGYAGSPFNLANSIQTSNQARGVNPADVCQTVRSELATGGANPDHTTKFWRERNYYIHADRVKASVFVVHGLNDYNVKPHNYGRWWDALEEQNVPRKIWLSQVAHEKAFDFRRDEWLITINRWFDHWLQGIENGIMDEPMADVEYAPDQWATYDTWPGGTRTTLHLGRPDDENDPRPGALHLDRRPSNQGTQTFTETRQSRNSAAQNGFDVRSDRLVFMTDELSEPVRVSGTPDLRLRGRFAGTSGMLSAYLVDYGTAERTLDTVGGGIEDLGTISCFGEGTEVDSGCYADVRRRTSTNDFYVLARGWADARYITGESELEPGELYGLNWEIFTDDYVFETGHRIGIVITGSDTTVRDPYPSSARDDITIQLDGSRVRLPIVGGAQALADATGGP
jgi:X-Pro dipeptidyl-peptidase